MTDDDLNDRLSHDATEHPTQFAAFVLGIALIGGVMVLLGTVTTLPRKLWRRIAIPRCAICRTAEYQRFASITDMRGATSFQPVCGRCVSLPPTTQARWLERAA